MWFAIELWSMLGREMKAAGELVDELVLHHPVTIAGAGIFDGADVLSKSQHGMLRDAFMREPQQCEQLFHAHAQLMCGRLLILREPPHIILRTLAELMQQTLQLPP